MSQRQDILDLLTERGSAGVYVYELNSAHPHGLGISQYGRCIKELRERGWDIINTTPGHFVLRTDSQLPVYLKPQAPQVTTQPQIQPEIVDRSSLVPVEKTIMILGVPRTTIAYVRKEDVETRQLVMI